MNKIFINKIIIELHSIQDILRWTISKFNATNIYYGHGTDNFWDEALQLIFTSLFLPLDTPKRLWSSRLTLDERSLIIKRVFRRINDYIPIAYLINKAWFCKHELYVDERVLIPRSPIGELINNHFKGIINDEPINILDMCTGSGCIAIACAYEFPKVKIDAVDISHDVLIVAKKNINNHNLSNRITLITSDLFLNIPKIKYDLIIINPPYVTNMEILNLPAEYLAEPKLALVAGFDGLSIINRVLANALHFLTYKGILICEVGNTKSRLISQYPDVNFNWLKLLHGGDGIFMLTKKQLIKYQDKFKKFIN